jgi:protein-S-isoprenylcysteine O-methyltransferase Ste14
MSAQQPVPQRPPSDVSAGVGLAGLAGLFAWILVCRNWGGLALALGLPGPYAPLSGPYAALLAVVFSGLPMVLWSLLVDKVHRRASTGIDWGNPRPLSQVVDISVTKLAGLWATWGLIAAVYCLARWYWRGQYLFAMDVLEVAAPLMVAGSVPYVLWLDRVLVNPRDGAWHFGAMLIGREPYDREEVRHHLRAWAVKGFFCAFMISILPGGFAAVVETDWGAIGGNPVRLSVAATEIMFVVDVQIAMVGYLLTMKPLDAHIRTANPYFAGWFAALACYPPFQLMEQGRPLWYQEQTADWAYWLQGWPVLLWIWAAALVVLTAIYAWATVAFGLRFSNLTYRGVLTNGPYAWTRHPAYLSKNAYWWLATLPFLVTNHSMVDAIRNTVCLGLVSAIYFWRAKTEERHLLAEDAKYREYHAWMGRNAPLVRLLARIGGLLRPRGVQVQPAE